MPFQHNNNGYAFKHYKVNLKSTNALFQRLTITSSIVIDKA